MSIIQLPIVQSPIVGLQYLAYPLCILLNYEDCFPWFYSNYIQLLWSSDFTSQLTFFPSWFSTNAKLEVQVLKNDIIKINNINIHNFIMNCINDKLYFYSVFDEFYVPHRKSYANIHKPHDFMIYGYDSIQKEYILLGYTDKQVFETTKISFEQFEEAFFSNAVGTENIYLFNKKDELNCGFDLQLVYEMLDDYLNSRNSSERCRMHGNISVNSVFGLDVYKHLRKYFDLLISGDIDSDIRPLHILFEHKKCMLSRLEYMYTNNYIDGHSYLYDNYKYILNKALAMRNLQLKYYITRDKMCLSKIVNILFEIEQKEKELLEILLDKIHNKL